MFGCCVLLVTQPKAFKTFFSPKFGVAMVIKDRHEVLDQKVWENQHFRDTQEDLDSIIISRKDYCVRT